MANGFFTDRAVATSPFRLGGTGPTSVSALIPIPYGQVRVCTSADIGTGTTPCPHLASIQDVNGNNLSVPVGGFGQVSADTTGRFSFQAGPGVYQIQVAPQGSNVPQLNYPITVSNFALGAAPTLSGNNVFTGTNLFNGGLSATNFEGTLYADQFTSTAAVTPPSTAPLVNVVSTGGSVGANQFACKVTYQGASGGETTASGGSNIFTTTGATNQLECTDINYPPPAGAKCYNVYWQTGGAGNFFLGHSCIAFNVGDVQTTAPATSGTQPPVSNTATSILSSVQATAGSPGTYVLPPTLSSTLGSQGAPSSGQTILDYRDGTMFMQPVAGANIGLFVNVLNPSVANTQLQAGVVGSLGNVNIATEWNRGQAFYPYAGVLGIVLNPNPSTIQGAAGVMGIAATTSPDTTGGGAVGGYFQGNCLANQTKCWGINPVLYTKPGITSDFWAICELDINSHDTSAVTANGLLITGASSAIPTASSAIGISSPDAFTGGCSFGSCARWGTGLALGTGAANVAISIGPAAGGNSQTSMPVNFVNTDAGGVFRTSAIIVSNTGDFVFQPFANFSISSGGFSTNSFVNMNNSNLGLGETGAPGGGAGFDRIYGDSASHSIKGSYNNSNFHFIPLVERGTCTMVAGTCTFTFAASFGSVPICAVTWNGTGALTGIVKAVPATNNVVVTSSVGGDTAVMQVICDSNPN